MSLVSKCIDEEFRGLNLLINLVLIFIGLKQNIIAGYQYWGVLILIILLKCYSVKTLKEEDKKKEGFDYSLVRPSNEDIGNIYLNPFSKQEVLTDEYRKYKTADERQVDLLNRLKIVNDYDRQPTKSINKDVGNLPSPIPADHDSLSKYLSLEEKNKKPNINKTQFKNANVNINNSPASKTNKTNKTNITNMTNMTNMTNKNTNTNTNTNTIKLNLVKTHVKELCNIVECNK